MIAALLILNSATMLILLFTLWSFYKRSILKQKAILSYLKYDEEFKKCTTDTNLWYVHSIKYLLIAMCRYIDSIKEEAVRQERYEDAKRCQEAIKEMNKLINA